MSTLAPPLVRQHSLALTSLLALACFSACATNAHSAPEFSSFSSGAPKMRARSDALAVRAAQLQGALVVPPDRALLGLRLTLTHEGTRAAAVAAREDWLQRFTKTMSRPAGCSVRVLDLAPPKKTRGGRATAAADLVAEVILVSLKSVQERAARLSACVQALDDHLTPPRKRRAPDGASLVAVGAWSLGLDQPQSLLPAALAKASERLKATLVQDLAPQLRPLDRRCVPTGEVVLRARTLAGIHVEAELICDVLPAHSDPGARGSAAP